jgi:hypothetical protein
MLFQSTDIDCTKPYFNQDVVLEALSHHNSNCECREVRVTECTDIMCIVKALGGN